MKATTTSSSIVSISTDAADRSLMEPLLERDFLSSEEEAAVSVKPRTSGRREKQAARAETCGRIRLLAITFLVFILVYVSICFSGDVDMPQLVVVHIPPDDNISGVTDADGSTTQLPLVPDGYLVWSPRCKIGAMDVMSAEVKPLFSRKKPVQCSTRTPMTTVRLDRATGRYSLVVSRQEQIKYGIHGAPNCCYMDVIRGSHDDKTTKLSPCQKFNQTFELPASTEFISVECRNGDRKEATYKNVHFVVQRKPEVTERLSNANYAPTDKRAPSVLMVGIDSISRLNLIRAMPKTAQLLYDNGWFEMKGYNKMGDNTYPNLMAVLTGYNLTWAYNVCKPTTMGSLNKCPFVWQDFARAGYATGYAEDETAINTFNYNKEGFAAAPVDYYGRPGMMVAEKLPRVGLHGLSVCVGFQYAADYIYQYGLDFAEQYKDDQYFGLFWTNSFSHNELSDPTCMDGRVKYYLEELERRLILKNSIVIFFSDHGIRFGPIRKLVTGWLEERLPFLFIWLPPWFRDEHPEIVRALKINRNRLTNPYDLHLTLKHIIRLSERVPNNNSTTNATTTPSKDTALGCLNCQSMFEVVPLNRSCEDIGIEPHWCTCAPYRPISKKSDIAQRTIKYVVSYMNEDVKQLVNDTLGPKKRSPCATLHFRKIIFVGETTDNASYNDILISFEVSPGGGEFESTVRYRHATKKFQMTGSISRLNSYNKDSGCVTDDNLRKYCKCL